VFILLFCVVSISYPVSNYLSGAWKNELGSTLVLVAEDGILDGIYRSAVGVSGEFRLTGLYNSDDIHTTLGWVVTWKNKNVDLKSTTSWSGEFLNGKLRTTWLLSIYYTPFTNFWNSTNIGVDVFIKID